MNHERFALKVVNVLFWKKKNPIFYFSMTNTYLSNLLIPFIFIFIALLSITRQTIFKCKNKHYLALNKNSFKWKVYLRYKQFVET